MRITRKGRGGRVEPLSSFAMKRRGEAKKISMRSAIGANVIRGADIGLKFELSIFSRFVGHAANGTRLRARQNLWPQKRQAIHIC
jgi:hypothetical protein